MIRYSQHKPVKEVLLTMIKHYENVDSVAKFVFQTSESDSSSFLVARNFSLVWLRLKIFVIIEQLLRKKVPHFNFRRGKTFSKLL